MNPVADNRNEQLTPTQIRGAWFKDSATATRARTCGCGVGVLNVAAEPHSHTPYSILSL